MKLKFLGTGTSQGVPVIGCQCKVCTSQNPKDQRLRTSALITTNEGYKILFDCGPDFRLQMLRQNEKNIDAIFLTHEHNDHVIGLDDVRPILFRSHKAMPIYCNKRVGKEIKNRFPYAFANEKYPGAPSFDIHEIDGPTSIFDTEIIPIDILHYHLPILGFKIKNTAYITDASFISDEEKLKLKNLDYLILNCIRKTDPHPAHFILEDILKLNKELQPKMLFLTHLSHHFGLHEDKHQLPENVQLAYDGLEFEF
ncbi:MAG: MBL fold metallo-hydrolase [Bacteroidetes bacterium]|nr:MBL fold metallo-hydrolase [Bacteroidota bacterium]